MSYDLAEKSVSKKQQRFFGMVRAAQKGEMEDPSPEITKVASTVSKSDVKKMASTKHKGLPEKVPANEGVVNAYKKGIKRHAKAVEKKKIKDRKAVPYAALAAEFSPELPATESYEINPVAHKAAQKKSKMRNLARGNENPNEKAAAQKKAGGPKLVGEAALEEERSARKLNVRSKKTIQTTIKKDAEKEAKRRANKTGEYKETPKKKPKLGLGYTTVVKHAQAKKAAAKKVPAAKKTPVTKATVKAASKKVAPSTKSDARTKAQYKGKGAPGLDAHKERIAKHEAKRGVKKPKAAKKTPVTKATTTKPAPKKAPARKSVKSTPITKAASTPKKQKTFGDFVKQGVKRHRKATQGARVFGKGFAKGVKKSVKFAKDVKKVVTNEQVNKVSAMVKSIKRKKEVLRQPEKAMDAGARAKRKLLRREYEAKVSTFVPDELKDHKTWDNFRQRL